jgi:flagellar basal-body rod protein FlgB
MAKLIDAALGIHPQAIALGARRLELIAGNMANADTPGFKARDLDFRATLQSLLPNGNGPASTLRLTHAGHQAAAGQSIDGESQYRIPNHPSLDGNTVDTQLEQSAFAEASVRYQASLDFLDARIQGLRKALRGD